MQTPTRCPAPSCHCSGSVLGQQRRSLLDDVIDSPSQRLHREPAAFGELSLSGLRGTA